MINMEKQNTRAKTPTFTKSDGKWKIEKSLSLSFLQSPNYLPNLL